MTPAEARLAFKLLGDIDRCSIPIEDWLHPTPEAIKKRNKRSRLKLELATLAESVAGRELGIKRYMVVQVTQDDGDFCEMQVLSMSLYRCSQGNSVLAWELSGRNIRKDGTLGLRNDEYAYPADASILRRRLDGSWAKLNGGRLNETGS